MSHTVFENGLGYEGKVTLTLKSNDRVLQSKTYKNNGTIHLFRFLGYCLTGAYAEAAKLLPTKILLLYNSSGSPVSATPTQVDPCTRFQPRVQTPTIISDSDNAQVKVIYNFEVSRASITAPFNQIALYGDGMSYPADIVEFSAYHFLETTDGKFDLIATDNWSTTTVLLVEWELTISNKNTETNNS